jgi:hypothetical protein
LPWIKLAVFGDRRSGLNCLRHNANVLGITGVEGDYDGEKVSFAVAVRILRASKVAALLYTSPSHTAKAPHWRVLAPTSIRLPPERRTPLLARINGLFGGSIFAPESFTLSQSYYFGAVRGNKPPQVVITPGICIDLRHDLDAGAVVNKYAAKGNIRRGAASIKKLMASDIDMVAAAVAVIPNDFPDDPEAPAWFPWKRIGMAIWAATGGNGFDIFDEFSRRWEFGAYDEHLTQRCWREICGTPPNNIGAGTIFYMADQASPGWRNKYEVKKWDQITAAMLGA